MAVIYICDRCGTRTEPNQLRQAELSMPPDPDIALDLCLDCAAAVREHLVAGAASASDGGDWVSSPR